jgi:hypothetical protein
MLSTCCRWRCGATPGKSKRFAMLLIATSSPVKRERARRTRPKPPWPKSGAEGTKLYSFSRPRLKPQSSSGAAAAALRGDGTSHTSTRGIFLVDGGGGAAAAACDGGSFTRVRAPAAGLAGAGARAIGVVLLFDARARSLSSLMPQRRFG